MQVAMTRRIFAAFSLILSACTGMGQDGRGYPSLAKRPMESNVPGDAVITQDLTRDEEAAQPVEPGLIAQLTTLTKQSEKGKAAFDAVYSIVAPRVRLADGAAISSEKWVAANVDLGQLEQARYDSVYALASLDTLYADRMRAVAAGEVQGGVAEIESARAPVLSMVDAQNDRVDELRAVLKEP